MTHRGCAVVLAGLAWSLTAASMTSAAEVPLRSGEHRTFSRLVFADAPSRRWEISRPAKGRVVIDFSAGSPDLDTSGVFDLIPRDRIVGVATDGRQLTLELGCDCPVEVFQIPTGHVVIDVRDGAPLPRPPAPRQAPILPVVFAMSEMPYRPPAAPRRPVGVVAAAPEGVVGLGPRQVRLHPSGVVPLVRARAGKRPETIAPARCEIEAIAHDALLADPAAAFASLAGLRAQLLDGEDRLDRAAMRRLALAHLASGQGAEAAQVAALDPSDDGVVGIVAAAVDGGAEIPRGRIDPGCGPATATVALLDPAGTEHWDRTDTSSLRSFLDGLDPTTLALVRPRLDSRLADLGDGDLMLGLGLDPSPDPEPTNAQETLAAGTGEIAILAATALLERSNEAGLPASETHLMNAMALLPSIPAGDLHDALQRNLAAALVLSRRPSEAVAMVADGRAAAEPMLTLALDRLGPAESAEFAVRLGRYLPEGSDAARRAADLFTDAGLSATARSFAGEAGDRLPAEASVDGPSSDPWMTRDLQAMRDADPAGWTDRNRLASEILDRNATPLPETDLAAAASVLERSRTVSGLVASLLATDAAGVTPR